MSDPGSSKVKVAILGGGVGAISAAFALTNRPEDCAKYDVTVYQMGWRLGGKGASGRNQDRDKGQRIEEHGLHVWMGCYNNAFHVMQQAYDECRKFGLTPGTPFPNWDDAFKPHSQVTLFEEIDGEWPPWIVTFPTNSALPGHGGVWLDPWDYVVMLARWIFRQVHTSTHSAIVEARKRSSAKPMPDGVRYTYARTVSGGRPVAIKGLSDEPTHVHFAYDMSSALSANEQRHDASQHHAMLWLLDDFHADLRATTQSLVGIDTALRHIWILIDLAMATVRGIIKDGVLFDGMDPLDRWDFREWLARHGASAMSVWSAPVKALYDLVFAYEKGNADKPNVAASGGLRTVLRVCLAYKGAFCFKMQAGMGDCVFTPLYHLLKRRGVKFKFFHRVNKLGVSRDRSQVETIEIAVQATVKPQLAEYQPLVTVRGLGCWPSEPLYEQLVEGDELKKRHINLESSWTPWQSPNQVKLERGRDFDLVVVGMSVAQLRYSCAELVSANRDWRAMIDGVQSVQTENVQVWHNRTAQEMGRTEPERILFGSYPWSGADMSQVEPRETWDPAYNVRTVAYYCRQLSEPDVIPPFTDPNFPDQEAERVKRDGLELMNTMMRPIWPKATDPHNPDGIDWRVVVDPNNGTGQARFDFQFWKANIDPTERYVLSVKNSLQYRLPSDESGFRNVYLAGDWTKNGLDMGCVEAAVISGMQVSRAISGHPKKIVGESDTVFSATTRPGMFARFMLWLCRLFGIID